VDRGDVGGGTITFNPRTRDLVRIGYSVVRQSERTLLKRVKWKISAPEAVKKATPR
jgi:hypothetical protein